MGRAYGFLGWADRDQDMCGCGYMTFMSGDTTNERQEILLDIRRHSVVERFSIRANKASISTHSLQPLSFSLPSSSTVHPQTNIG